MKVRSQDFGYCALKTLKLSRWVHERTDCRPLSSFRSSAFEHVQWLCRLGQNLGEEQKLVLSESFL